MEMTVSEFKSSLLKDNPPAGLSTHLEALWYD